MCRIVKRLMYNIKKYFVFLPKPIVGSAGVDSSYSWTELVGIVFLTRACSSKDLYLTCSITYCGRVYLYYAIVTFQHATEVGRTAFSDIVDKHTSLVQTVRYAEAEIFVHRVFEQSDLETFHNITSIWRLKFKTKWPTTIIL